MPRSTIRDDDPVNGDSFVDIVAAIVGIMIIMVVLEGARIKSAQVNVSIPPPPAAAELEKELAAEQSVRADVWKTAEETRDVQREAVASRLRRDYLATAVAAAEHEIQSRRGKLDEARRAEFDRADQLAQARRKLEELARGREQLERQPADQIVVESYPTPISRSVDGPEAHLLVANGRVLFIPLAPLLEEFKTQAKRNVQKLLDQPEFTDTIGPVGGFRLRYTLERYEVPLAIAQETGRGGSYARLRKWILIPVADDLGEPVRLALEKDSDFRRELAKILPGRTTITIWIYPDGFEAFRQIRKELYRLGYSIAARPLPPGTPIGGSPDGSKSAAQ